MPYLRLVPQTLAKLTPRSRASSNSLYNLHLSCYVKPNSKAPNHGRITAIRPDQIDVSVSAAPRDGEANKAIAEVIAEVLNVPRSDVEVIRGGKSREKVLQVRDWDGVSAGTEGESRVLQAVQEMLERACAKQ